MTDKDKEKQSLEGQGLRPLALKKWEIGKSKHTYVAGPQKVEEINVPLFRHILGSKTTKNLHERPHS